MEIELAVALSTRDWPDELHRFLADHGGARIRLTAVRPDELLAEGFDVLLVDDVCSFLTPRLVESVRSAGRGVVGVFDPDEFADGKERLLECGVSDVVDCRAEPEEVLAVVGRVAGAGVLGTAPARSEHRREGRIVVVGGPPGGVGVTEVAIALASRLAARRDACVLVDADSRAPSVAQRLDLPVHPNVLAAVDAFQHREAEPESLLDRRHPFAVLPGAPHEGRGSAGVVEIVHELASAGTTVVADAGAGTLPGAGPLLHAADLVAAVALPTPVGIARLLDWLATARAVGSRPAHVLVNRAPRDRYRRGELIEEVTRSYRPAGLAFLPDDPGVAEAVWEGVPTRPSGMARALDRWLDRAMEPPS